jgi:cupin fold WbuC family metalloprotein|tara:strand:- start:741 stop:1157 length:417 start_codon:yes stop_codon:yes gene_type:complete
MKKIYSKVEPNKLLHIIVRKDDLVKGRTEVVSEEHFIQCALLNMEKDKTFKPHKHIWKNRTRDVIAQESWVVIQGKVKCTFFDIDDNIIEEPILEAGDASFTLEGGHTYTILEDDTLVYEYKTGPYEGQELDKVFIGD